MNITRSNVVGTVLPSPYTPGSGMLPRALVGRAAMLSRLQADIARVRFSGEASPSVTMFAGARGMGKTVLLNQAHLEAEHLGFVIAHVGLDRSDNAIQRVARAIAEAVAPLQPMRSRWQQFQERLAEFSLQVSAGGLVTASAKWKRSGAEVDAARDHLRGLIVDAAQVARESAEGGLLVTLDEVQECPAEQLGILAHAIQDVCATGAPVVFVGAGLAHLPEVLMKAASFAERFRFVGVETLRVDDAYLALTKPAWEVEVEWEPEAADLVLQAAAGAPFLLQLYGEEAWRQAAPVGPGVITERQARAGITVADETLSSGMFRGRWAMASELERSILEHMASSLDEDHAAAIADVAKAMGRKVQELSTPRRRLIDKGIIESRGRGKLGFTMPGFERYVLNRDE